MTPEQILRDALRDAALAAGAPADFQPQLERPRDPAFGDWASNAAMLLARHLKRKPLEIAQDLVARLDVARAGVSEAYVAGAGFINFRLAAGAEAAGLADVLAAGSTYGRSNEGEQHVVNVEFVSANPTGPLHVGHGRQAAIGDAVSTLLEWTGWQVTREFYYNDAGVQIANLARSVQARVRELTTGVAEIPEGGYHGEYIREIARDYVGAYPGDAAGNDLEAIRAFAVAALRHEQDKDLQAFGVRFDVYYLESSLYTDGKVDETVRLLVDGGHTFEKDGALWLRTTDYGDDKDRVMRKSDGTYTYFLPDVAYHLAKWRRGFARAINVQGADHHSTVTRVRAGLQALGTGIPRGYPEYELHQMVTVMRGGEEVKISKRAGSYVTVRDLIDEVGRDAVRYFLLMRKSDSQLVFDVDVARAQSEENPVYYIQMAHARLCGIFRVGEIAPDSITGAGVEWGALVEDDERELVKALLGFPGLVTAAARTLAPHLVATYLLDTARLVHTWYHKHHVLGEPEPVRSARLALARAAQVVLANGLAILGISAPERM
ncbi:MAG: arginine--tRNA ligase [Gemmatimonadetes bacterium SCN 70-22]|nr:MAG: arginine--tRNA ligase [Gemmatimonadetes bacterium SCN 70-22]